MLNLWNCVTDAACSVLSFLSSRGRQGRFQCLCILANSFIVCRCDCSHLSQFCSCIVYISYTITKRYKDHGSLSKLGEWVMWHIEQKPLFSLDFPPVHYPILYLWQFLFVCLFFILHLGERRSCSKPLLSSLPESCSQRFGGFDNFNIQLYTKALIPLTPSKCTYHH